MTWRNDVYPQLGIVNSGFEQITAALEALRDADILEDGTVGSMYDDLENLWFSTNYVILTELLARESQHEGNYEIVNVHIEKVRKRLKSTRP